MSGSLLARVSLCIITTVCSACLPAVDRYDVEVMTIVNQSQETLRCEAVISYSTDIKQVVISQGHQDTLKTAYHIKKPVRVLWDFGSQDISRMYSFYVKDTVRVNFDFMWTLFQDSTDIHDVRWRKIAITDSMITVALSRRQY